MVFTLRVEDALAQLRRAFPTSVERISDFAVAEPTDYPDEGAADYRVVQQRYIEPIERAWHLCLRIGAAVANEFGAHG